MIRMTFLAICTEDSVFGTTPIRGWPEPEYTGHDGLRRSLIEWLEVWDGFEVGVEELVAAADGRCRISFLAARQRRSKRAHGRRVDERPCRARDDRLPRELSGQRRRTCGISLKRAWVRRSIGLSCNARIGGGT